MVVLSFGGTDEQVTASLQKFGPTLIGALAKRLTFLMIKLQRHIQVDKLQGQVLAQRSGRLVNSIRASVREDDGQLIGTVKGAGGVAWYGMVHERGGRGFYKIEPINGKALAFFPSGSGGMQVGKSEMRKLYSGPMSKRTLLPSAFDKFGKLGGIIVKSVNHPPAQKRSFMATGFEDMTDEIFASLQAEADEQSKAA